MNHAPESQQKTAPSAFTTGCEAPGSHDTGVPSIGWNASPAAGARPSTENRGWVPVRFSVTVRISRAASAASLASGVPGTAARTWSNFAVLGMLRNDAGTSAGATRDHAPPCRLSVSNQRPDASR